MSETVRVYNRSNSLVSYVDQETKRKRVWQPIINGVESYKDIEIEEIERVISNDYGAKVLYEDYLVIKDKDVCEKIGISCPKEYFYDAKEIQKILETGTDFDLVEMIEFNNGALGDLIKQIAVEIKLDSSRKRQIIKDRLNFNVNFAIENEVEFANKVSVTEQQEKKAKYITQ